MTKVAFMVDGGFFRNRSQAIWGKQSAQEVAKKLDRLCKEHLKYDPGCELYRIFYYDCKPSGKKVNNPLTNTTKDLSQDGMYKWTETFFTELKKIRKMALRFGSIQDSKLAYTLKPAVVKDLLNGKRNIKSLTDDDLKLNITQKGVDMRIGLDIASLAHKKLVNQIVLISGDSDFIPIVKYARREGIDFILDSMGDNIKPELFEHLDEHRNLHLQIT